MVDSGAVPPERQADRREMDPRNNREGEKGDSRGTKERRAAVARRAGKEEDRKSKSNSTKRGGGNFSGTRKAENREG